MAFRDRKGSAAPTSRRSAKPRGEGVTGKDHDPTAAEIAPLVGKGVDSLRDAWRQRFGSPAPKIQSADILRRLLAWKIQAETFGGLDAETVAELKRARSAIAEGKSPVSKSNVSQLRAGTVLVREWRGTMHRVLVLDGSFEHEGRRFSSLSEVARAISGTRWSGPRFFGLQERPSPGSANPPVAETRP
jgi:hypothetical protein